MRVAYLSPFAGLGGAEWSLLDLMGAVRSSRPSWPLFLVVPEEGPLLERAAALGVEVRVCRPHKSIGALGDSGLRGLSYVGKARFAARACATASVPLLRYIANLTATLRQLSPDIVHSNGMKAHMLAALAAPRSASVVWHMRDFVSSRPLLGTALAAFGRRAALVLANSEAVAADVRLALPGRPVEVLYNAVDERFTPMGDVADLDDWCGMTPARSADLKRVGIVATFARWKGQDVFLEAAARVLSVDTAPPVRFYIIGAPIYETLGSQWSRAELQERAKRLGIAGHVGFAGFRPDVAAVYRALDVVVHASTQPEPFGRTVVEAMACGRAVMVAKAGGAAELFADGVTAVGVAPNDARALAERMTPLLVDHQERARLGETAAQHVREAFSMERLSHGVLRCYERLRR